MNEKAISECMSHSAKRQGIRGRLSFGIGLGEHNNYVGIYMLLKFGISRKRGHLFID